MSTASTVSTVIMSTPYLARMFLSLYWTYLTLNRKVRKARKAFEEQLTQQGMSKQDAKRLSLCFEELKNNVTGMLKQGLTSSLRRQ